MKPALSRFWRKHAVMWSAEWQALSRCSGRLGGGSTLLYDGLASSPSAFAQEQDGVDPLQWRGNGLCISGTPKCLLSSLTGDR